MSHKLNNLLQLTQCPVLIRSYTETLIRCLSQHSSFTRSPSCWRGIIRPTRKLRLSAVRASDSCSLIPFGNPIAEHTESVLEHCSFRTDTPLPRSSLLLDFFECGCRGLTTTTTGCCHGTVYVLQRIHRDLEFAFEVVRS